MRLITLVVQEKQEAFDIFFGSISREVLGWVADLPQVENDRPTLLRGKRLGGNFSPDVRPTSFAN
jgi:hypothetical protein